MTESGYLKTMLTALGGDPSKLPDNLESTCYKAIIELLLNNGGGGGSNSEYKQPEWGYKEDYILPETDITLSPNEDLGMVVGLTEPPLNESDFQVGEEYVVIYDGVEYRCTYAEFNALGNGYIMGGEDTGEPFFIVNDSGATVVIPINQTAGIVKVGVKGNVTKKIESVYAPEVPYIDLVAAGLPSVNTDSFVRAYWGGEYKKVLMAMGYGAIQLRLKLNGLINNVRHENTVILCTAQLGAGIPLDDGELNQIYGNCFYHNHVIRFIFEHNHVDAIITKLFEDDQTA